MICYGIFFLLLFLSGCGVGPTYKKPQVNLPNRYSSKLKGEKRADLVCWWDVFEDDQLNELIQTGLCQNFDLKIAFERIEEARNIHRIQVANILPTIDALAGVFGSNIPRNFFPDASRKNGPFSFVGFNTLWELDIWGRLRKNQNSARYQFEAQIENMRDVWVVLVAQIAQSYLLICSLHEKIKVQKNIIEIDTRIAELTQDTFVSGLENRQALLEQQAILDQDKADLIELMVDEQVALHQLAYLLGETPDQLSLSMDCIEGVPQPTRDIEIDQPYELLRRRPDIRKSEKLLAASYEEIGAAMAEWFPKISVVGFLAKTFGPLSGLCGRDPNIWAAGPLFDWPALDFGRIYFNIRAKQSSQRQALLTYQKSVVEAFKEVENALVSYVQEKQRLHLLAQKKAHASQRANLEYDQFMSGIKNELIFLSAQKRLDKVCIEFIDSQQKMASHFIVLYKALGGGW